MTTLDPTADAPAVRTPRTPITLADVLPIPDGIARTAGLIVGFALLTAAAAQLSFHLPWTPVPVTGQTFAVLLTGAALGWRAGGLSQLLYVAMGAVGLPFYAGHAHGWKVVTGASGGYLVGFIAAAAIVGALAERRNDRSVLTSLPAMLAGNAVVYVFGVPWLAHVLHANATKALELGFTPFVIGDTLKLIAAGLLLPAAWKVARRPSD